MIIKKYALYLLRWQLSTPILAPIVAMFTGGSIVGTPESWLGACVANLIGGCIFFWVDGWIFKKTDILHGELWEKVSAVYCADCGSFQEGLRLVKAKGYDKSLDPKPEFRCPKCSRLKYINEYLARRHDD